MKKFLSSILVFSMAFTSFSAISCFASENNKTTYSSTKSIKTETLSDKFKKVAGYAVTIATVGTCIYFACNHNQNISNYLQESFNKYMPTEKICKLKKFASNICTKFVEHSAISTSEKLSSNVTNKFSTLFVDHSGKTLFETDNLNSKH